MYGLIRKGASRFRVFPQGLEDGTFQITFLDPATYTLGCGTLDLENFVLTFDATVEPAQVTVNTEAVEGVAYTTQSAECQPAT